MRDDHWASDVPISRPEPPPGDVPVLVDFQGFGFSMNGMVHNLTEADVEEMTTPYFAPQQVLPHDPLDIQGEDGGST